MTRLRLHIAAIFLLSLGWAGMVQAQPDASTFFHDGAQQYIDGEMQTARQTVTQGLQAHPNDPKLLALQKKLKQRQQQQSSQGDNEQNQNDDSEKKKQESSKSNDQQEKKDNQQQQRQSQNEQNDESQHEQQPNQQNQQNQPPQQGPRRQQQHLPQDPEKISRQQALRILQALENQEQKLLREVQKPEGRRRRVEKDW